MNPILIPLHDLLSARGACFSDLAKAANIRKAHLSVVMGGGKKQPDGTRKPCGQKVWPSLFPYLTEAEHEEVRRLFGKDVFLTGEQKRMAARAVLKASEGARE